MTGTISLRVFLACLVICASMALVGIWFGEHRFPPAYFQTTASIFIIGLTSFLVWFSNTLLAIKNALRSAN